MINVASYSELHQGDPITVQAFPLGASSTEEFRFDSGLIYVLVEGTCEISLDVEIPNNTQQPYFDY
jgi:hypothetical protein